jgi:large subunit ribosomal protein L30
MSAARAKESGASLHVRQVRSGIGFDKTQKATLRAMGLGKLGRVRELPDNKEIRGMIAKIPHLVQVLNRSQD